MEELPHPFAPHVLSAPHAFYQAAHARGPALKVPGTPITMILSYDAVADALGRPQDFGNEFGAVLAGGRATDPDVAAILATGWPAVDTLLTADPPRHTRFRKLVNLAFSARRVDAITGRIRTIAERLLDDMADKPGGDFIEDFAIPLPVAVIAGEIGMDATTDVATVKRWSDAFTDRLGNMASRQREIECAREVVAFQHHAKRLIDDRRRARTDDLLSDLVHATVDGETPLEDAEIMSILQQLMVAGNETTTSTLAGGLLLLLENPAELARVRADASLIPNMVEEMLRLESPTAGLPRVVKREAQVAGVTVRPGEMLMLRFAAANRDPARFPDPDRFDPARANARTHLAFGRGIHMCVGNMLSRREMAVAFELILDRMAHAELEPGAALTYPPNMMLRGLKSLPLRWNIVGQPTEQAA